MGRPWGRAAAHTAQGCTPRVCAEHTGATQRDCTRRTVTRALRPLQRTPNHDKYWAGCRDAPQGPGRATAGATGGSAKRTGRVWHAARQWAQCELMRTPSHPPHCPPCLLRMKARWPRPSRREKEVYPGHRYEPLPRWMADICSFGLCGSRWRGGKRGGMRRANPRRSAAVGLLAVAVAALTLAVLERPSASLVALLQAKHAPQYLQDTAARHELDHFFSH